MKIETKLDIRNECYFMEDNKIVKGRIEKIEVHVDCYDYIYDTMDIYYTVSSSLGDRFLEESEVFESVEKLLEKLGDNVK